MSYNKIGHMAHLNDCFQVIFSLTIFLNKTPRCHDFHKFLDCELTLMLTISPDSPLYILLKNCTHIWPHYWSGHNRHALVLLRQLIYFQCIIISRGHCSSFRKKNESHSPECNLCFLVEIGQMV